MINTNAPVATYTGNGTTATFSFTFKANSASQIIIQVWNTTDNTLVFSERGNILVNVSTVTLTAGGGGSITLPANLAVNRKLIILLAADSPVQTNRFREQGDYQLRDIENALDAIVVYVQAMREELNRTLRIGPYALINTDINMKIEGVPPANGIPMFDANGEIMAWTTPNDIVTAAAGGGFVDANYGFTGYSARFSEAFATTTLLETLQQIVDITYLAPQISLSGTGSGTIREKGETLVNAALAATITKRSDDIYSVEYFANSVSFALNLAPNPAGGVENQTDTSSYTDTVVYRADVTDTGDTGGPTTVQSNTVTYLAVYPYYVGAGAAGLTAAQVAALTKLKIASSSTVNRTITAGGGEVFYFAYPASYGALTSILDVNNFETIGDWTLRTENITGLDASAQSYRIYEFNNPVVAGDYYYSFRR